MQKRYERDFVNQLTADPRLGLDDQEARRRFHWLVNALYKNRIEGASKGYGFFYEGGDDQRPGRQDLVESFHREVQAFTQTYGDIAAKGKTLLWSGFHVGRFAANDAAIRAKVGIEGEAQALNETAIGKLYDKLELITQPDEALGLTWDLTQNVWNTVSKSFAQTATGDVHVFIPSSIGALSIFWNVELPELRRRMAPFTSEAKVSSIQVHHLSEDALTQVNAIQNDSNLTDAQKAAKKKALMLRDDTWRNMLLDKASIEAPRESLPQKAARMGEEPRLSFITEMVVEKNEEAKVVTLEQLRKLGRHWRASRLDHRRTLRAELDTVAENVEKQGPLAKQETGDGLNQAQAVLGGHDPVIGHEDPKSLAKRRYRNEILYGRFENHVNKYMDLDGFKQSFTYFKAAVSTENLPKNVAVDKLNAYLLRQERAVRAVADMSEASFFPGVANHHGFGKGSWTMGLSDQQSADIRWLEREGEHAWLKQQLSLIEPRRPDGDYAYQDYLNGLAMNQKKTLRDAFRSFSRNNLSAADEAGLFADISAQDQAAVRALEKNLRENLGDQAMNVFLDDLDNAADDAAREKLFAEKRDAQFTAFARHKNFSDEVAVRRLQLYADARADHPDADESARLDALENEVEQSLGADRTAAVRTRLGDDAALRGNRDALSKLESPLQKRPLRKRIKALFFDQKAIDRVYDQSSRVRDTLLPLGRADTAEQKEVQILLDKERDHPELLTGAETSRLSQIKELAKKKLLGLNFTRAFPDYDILEKNKSLAAAAAKAHPSEAEQRELDTFLTRYAGEKKGQGGKPLTDKEKKLILGRLKIYEDYRKAYDLAQSDDPAIESDPTIRKRVDQLNAAPDSLLKMFKVKTAVTQRDADQNVVKGLKNLLESQGDKLDQTTKDKLIAALDDRLYNLSPSSDPEILVWKTRLGAVEANQIRRNKLEQVKTELALANYKSFKGLDASVKKLDNYMALGKLSKTATPDPDGTVTFDHDMKQKIYDTLGRKEYVAIFGAQALFGAGEKKLDEAGMKRLKEALAREKPAGLDEYEKYEQAVARVDAEAAAAFAQDRDSKTPSTEDAALLGKVDKAAMRNYKKIIKHQEGVVYEEKTRLLRTDDLSLLGDVQKIKREAIRRKQEQNERAAREELESRDADGNLTPASEADVKKLAKMIESAETGNAGEEANQSVAIRKFVKKLKDGGGSLSDVKDLGEMRKDVETKPPGGAKVGDDDLTGKVSSDEGGERKKQAPRKRIRRKRRKVESSREKRNRLAFKSLALRLRERTETDDRETEDAPGAGNDAETKRKKTA